MNLHCLLEDVTIDSTVDPSPSALPDELMLMNDSRGQKVDRLHAEKTRHIRFLHFRYSNAVLYGEV